MAKRQRLTLQQVLDEIFMGLLNEDDVKDHLYKDYGDSDEYSPEIVEQVPNVVTDTRNEPIPSTPNKFRLLSNRSCRTWWWAQDTLCPRTDGRKRSTEST